MVLRCGSNSLGSCPGHRATDFEGNPKSTGLKGEKRAVAGVSDFLEIVGSHARALSQQSSCSSDEWECPVDMMTTRSSETAAVAMLVVMSYRMVQILLGAVGRMIYLRNIACVIFCIRNTLPPGQAL